MASFRKTKAKEVYLGGKIGLGLAVSAARASSVAVVRRVMTGELFGRKREPCRMIQWIVLLSRARRIY